MATIIKKCVKTLTLASLMLAGFNSCCSDGEMSSKEKLLAYLAKDTLAVQVSSDKFAAYFDFSDGMQYAYSDDATKKVLEGIVQKITTHSDEFIKYSLANNEITELPDRMTDLYNTIMDPRSYQMQNAPIENALNQIVENGQCAVMITDFEEYTGIMEKAAFATPYFDKWLADGNEITFFVTDYTERGKDKHLYYIIFDTPKRSLLSMVKDGMEGKPQNYKTFLLSTCAYTLNTDYPSNSQGGNYRDSQGNDNVTSVIENGDEESFFKIDDMSAEYYPLGDNWNNIVFNARSLSEDGVPTEDQFKHLFSKLYLDLSQQDSYFIKDLDIKVYNIEKDFESYSNYAWALLQKGKENEADYYDETGALLQEYKYTPSQPIEILDMLEFDKNLFASTANEGNAHLSINLKPGFNGTIVGMEPTDMIRIDIYIKECEPNYDCLPDLFQWTGNDNLFESVKNTLQDMRPTGRVIYRYFVRAQQ